MDADTIQKIAAEVARHLSSRPWVLLLIQAILLLMAAGLGAYYGEYLKTRGKNLATKADFDTLLDQLRANTELVETIKTEVSQRDWAKREWTNLRRVKLEALLDTMHECDDYLDRFRQSAFEGKLLQERDPGGKFDTITDLYFPELLSEASAFSLLYRGERGHWIALLREMKQQQDHEALLKVREEHSAQWDSRKRMDARQDLRNAARKLLVEIMGVESQGCPVPTRSIDQHGVQMLAFSRSATGRATTS